MGRTTRDRGVRRMTFGAADPSGLLFKNVSCTEESSSGNDCDCAMLSEPTLVAHSGVSSSSVRSGSSAGCFRGPVDLGFFRGATKNALFACTGLSSRDFRLGT